MLALLTHIGAFCMTMLLISFHVLLKQIIMIYLAYLCLMRVSIPIIIFYISTLVFTAIYGFIDVYTIPIGFAGYVVYVGICFTQLIGAFLLTNYTVEYY